MNCHTFSCGLSSGDRGGNGKETIAVAIADARSSDVRFYGVIKNTPDAVVAMIKKLGDRHKRLRFEALQIAGRDAPAG